MIIRWHTPYSAQTGERYAEPGWPSDWPVPRIGETVQNQEAMIFMVQAVDWCPYGEDGSDPFVYVVLKRT